MKNKMDDLIFTWGELVDLRRKYRENGSWSLGDLELQKRYLNEIDSLVSDLQNAWHSWKKEFI